MRIVAAIASFVLALLSAYGALRIGLEPFPMLLAGLFLLSTLACGAFTMIAFDD